jgi:hypothetical protein
VSLRRCSVKDLLGITSRHVTDEGYLIAPGMISRAGNVQEYAANELGLPGGDKVIRLYRPPEEVFAQDSYRSFEGKPITDNHPRHDVHAGNWKEMAAAGVVVGDVHGVKPGDGGLAGTVIVRDVAAVRKVVEGKAQLSNGYDFELDLTPGVSPAGEKYDGVQRQIRGNHTAIVDMARGGSSCRIADHRKGDRPMGMIKLALDGFSVDLEEQTATIVQRVVNDATKRATDATAAATAAETRATTAETQVADLKEAATKSATDHAAKLAEIEAKVVKPEKIQELVVERTKLVADAAKLAPDYKPESKAPEVIRAEVVAHVLATDEAVKPFVTAALQGADPAKPESASVVAIAFDVALAAKGTTVASATDAATRAADRAMAGGGAGEQAVTKLTGRDLWMARQQDPDFQKDDAE